MKLTTYAGLRVELQLSYREQKRDPPAEMSPNLGTVGNVTVASSPNDMLARRGQILTASNVGDPPLTVPRAELFQP